MDRDKAGALTAALCFNWIHFPLHHRQIGTKSPQSHVTLKDLSCNGRLFLHNIFKILLSVLLRKSRDLNQHRFTSSAGCMLIQKKNFAPGSWHVFWVGEAVYVIHVYILIPLPAPSPPPQALGESVAPQPGCAGSICRQKLYQPTPAGKKGLCNK